MPTIDPNLLQPSVDTHDLSSYVYVTEGDVTATEYGAVDYSRTNLQYLINLFDESDDVVISSRQEFTYYNFYFRDFFPQRLNPYSVTEMDNNYSLNFTYNYYDTNYESVAAGAHESHLPNHYVIKQNNAISGLPTSLQLFYGDDVNEEAVASLATLGGSVNSFQYDSSSFLPSGLADQGFNFAYNPNNYYYQHYLNFQEYAGSEDFAEFRDKTRNCFMSFNKSVESTSAPFFSKMRINYRARPLSLSGYDNNTQALHGYQHMLRPYMYYFYHHITGAPSVDRSLSSVNRTYRVSEAIEYEESLGDLPLKIYPAATAEVLANAENSFLRNDEITLFDKVEYTDFPDHGFPLVESVFPNIASADNKVRRFLTEGFDWSIWKPGLGKFISGVPNFEPIIVCFKIEKFSGTSQIPVQTFYMDHDIEKSGTDGYSFLEFLDIQLKYGTNYRYKVSAICRIDTPVVKIMDMFYTDNDSNLYSVYINSVPSLTRDSETPDLRIESRVVSDFFGSFSGYTPTAVSDQITGYAAVQALRNPQANPSGPPTQPSFGSVTGLERVGQTTPVEIHPSPLERNKIYIKTEVRTKAEFMEIELFEDSITTLEPIFSPPEVKFFNENGKTNDVLVQAQLNYNNYRAEYIPITPEDSQSIERYLPYFEASGEYNFRTINGEGNFEIRRLSQPPKSYSDFANASVQQFNAPQPNNTIYSILAYAVNKVRPNRKYYYIVRALNSHGVYSNPTTVFQIELLQDSDDTFIIVDEYEFKNNLTNNYSKSGKRYLQLKVSNLQGLINEQSVEFEDASSADEISSVHLGPSDFANKVWGKTFKIRLTSEKTGKKIDLNVFFRHTDEPT